MVRLVSICIAACLCAAAHGQNPVGQARSKMGDYRVALNRAANATDAAAYDAAMTEAQNRLIEARRLFEEGGAPQAADADVLAEYADLLLILRSPDAAEPVLARAATLAPRDGAVWLRLGYARADLGPKWTERARDAFAQAAEYGVSDASKAEAHAAMGVVYFLRDYAALAAEAFARAAALDDDNPRAIIGAASSALREGRVLDASQGLDALGELPPDILRDMHRVLGKAVDDFAAAGVPFPDTAAHHLAYGRILVRLNRGAKALAPFEHAARIEPENTAAWNGAGSLRAGLGDPEGARAAFERSLAINPEQPRTREALAALTAPPPSPAPLQPQDSPF